MDSINVSYKINKETNIAIVTLEINSNISKQYLTLGFTLNNRTNPKPAFQWVRSLAALYLFLYHVSKINHMLSNVPHLPRELINELGNYVFINLPTLVLINGKVLTYKEGKLFVTVEYSDIGSYRGYPYNYFNPNLVTDLISYHPNNYQYGLITTIFTPEISRTIINKLQEVYNYLSSIKQ